MSRQQSALLHYTNMLTIYFFFPAQFFASNPQFNELLTLICCQQSHGLVLKEPPVHPVRPALSTVESCTPPLTTVYEKLTVSSMSFVPFVLPQQDRKTEEIQQERQTERGREKRGRQGGM